MLLFLACILIAQQTAIAQDNPAVKKKKVKHQLCLGPVISFYKNHKQHTANTRAKAGFNAAYRIDILIKKRTSFVTGLDFFSQGLTFKGYYAAPGFTYLYDETYPYTHELRYNELQLPLYFKLAFNKDKDNFYTGYVFGGVGFRYILNSYSIITNDSTNTTPFDGKDDLSFEHFIITKSVNTNIQAGFGVQKNFRVSGRALFLEFTYRHGISRIHYDGNKETNNLNIKDASLGITFGYRF